MAYRDLREFIRALEQNHELRRIPFEVDPVLEIAEFADRAVKGGVRLQLFDLLFRQFHTNRTCVRRVILHEGNPYKALSNCRNPLVTLL